MDYFNHQMSSNHGSCLQMENMDQKLKQKWQFLITFANPPSGANIRSGGGVFGRGDLIWLVLYAVADPGFSRNEGTNPPGRRGSQHTIVPKFSKNCMKLKEFGARGRPSRPLRSATDMWFTVADPESPRRGRQLLDLWEKNIIWQDFSRKLHENERNWTEGGFPSFPLPIR